MANDGNLGDRSPLSARVTISIAPISDADERLADMLGAFAFDLAQLLGCSGQTSSKANVLFSEETLSALENNLLSSGDVKVELTLTDADAHVHCVVNPGVASTGTDAWFPPDEATAAVENPMLKTIRRKRSDLAKGGLGLMHMKSETKKPLGKPGGGSSGPPVTVVPLPKKP